MQKIIGTTTNLPYSMLGIQTRHSYSPLVIVVVVVVIVDFLNSYNLVEIH